MARLVFAYGSNLDAAQMRRRCPSAETIARADLRDYRLAFAGWSTGWGGAVATIERAEGHRVHGLLYSVSEKDLERLDAYEGYPWVYDRRRLRFGCSRGGVLRAEAYVQPDAYHALPSGAYVSTIRRAYHALGFQHSRLVEAVRYSHDRALALLGSANKEQR